MSSLLLPVSGRAECAIIPTAESLVRAMVAFTTALQHRFSSLLREEGECLMVKVQAERDLMLRRHMAPAPKIPKPKVPKMVEGSGTDSALLPSVPIDILTFPVKSEQAANLHKDLAISTNLSKAPEYQSESYGDVTNNRPSEQLPPVPKQQSRLQAV